MTESKFPPGFRLERISKSHPRRSFSCGIPAVDDWLATKALQHYEKRLSTTTVLLHDDGFVVGYYTLAMDYVDCGDLPLEIARRLPRRLLPVVTLAWFGIASQCQGQGLGDSLFGEALAHCWRVSRALPFVAVILDCINEDAKRFYLRWEFGELPGRPLKLLLPAAVLDRLMDG